MAAKLVAEEGIQKGLTLSLENDTEWIIGRDPELSKLLIEDPSVSRKHLVCKKTAAGIVIENLSSTNPITINDEIVLEPKVLRNGDLIRIGEGLYRFYEDESAQLLDQGEVTQAQNPSYEENMPKNDKTTDLSENTNDQDIDLEFSELESLDDSTEGENREDKDVVLQNLGNKESTDELIPDDHDENIDSKTNNINELDEKENIEDLSSKENQEPIEQLNSEVNVNVEQKTSDLEELEKQVNDNESKDNPIKDLASLAREQDQEKEEDHLENEDHISIFEDAFRDEKEDYPQVSFDLTETSRWLLKVVGGPNQGAEFSMQPTTTYIMGTDPKTCDIVFHDTSVSRQHAKITVNEDETIVLEDLKSRNGTFIDGNPLNGTETIPTNTLITIGTSSFVVYDREGEMQTIISPLLPSIVKVLKEKNASQESSEATKEKEPPVDVKPLEPITPVVEPVKKQTHTHDALGAFILIAIITGLFVVIGIGTTTLFKSQPVVSQQVNNPESDLTQALSNFPSVKYSFNKSTGRLLLVGHVLTSSDKSQLMYNLQGLKYLRNIDDSGLIIDEGVWREINQILSQNQNWKGISIQSPTPGHFVISGFLKTRKQAEQLWDYISSNFPYLDLLEKRVIVEEEVVSNIGAKLQNLGFKDVSVQMNEGDVILTGHVSSGKLSDFNKALSNIKEIPGVRNLKNYVTELAPEQSMINISDKYDISGVSQIGSANTSVVINGRILTRGDTLDGMTITSIKSNAVFLEKDGTKYRIDYNR